MVRPCTGRGQSLPVGPHSAIHGLRDTWTYPKGTRSCPSSMAAILYPLGMPLYAKADAHRTSLSGTSCKIRDNVHPSIKKLTRILGATKFRTKTVRTISCSISPPSQTQVRCNLNARSSDSSAGMEPCGGYRGVRAQDVRARACTWMYAFWRSRYPPQGSSTAGRSGPKPK